MSETVRNGAYLLLLFIFFIACLVLLYFVPSEDIVRTIGVDNTYLVLFFFGIFAGFSSLTGGSFYAAVATFAAGGSNPIILGLAGGLGLFISDSIFYYVALRGIQIIRKKWNRLPEKIAAWVNARNQWLVLGFVYAYAAFIPVPSDILLGALAISDYPYKKFAPYLLVGDLTLALLIAALASFGITWGWWH